MAEPSGEKPPAESAGEGEKEEEQPLFAVLKSSHFEKGCGPGKTRPPWTLRYYWQWTFGEWKEAVRKKIWPKDAKELFMGFGRVEADLTIVGGIKQGFEVEIYARRNPNVRPDGFDFVVYHKKQSLGPEIGSGDVL